MRSKIFWTRLVRVAATSMRSRRPGSAWRLRRMNCRLLWKRLRQLLNKRRTRCCAASWNCPRCARRSTVASRRRKRNLRTPGE